jgi:hypothetical protein
MSATRPVISHPLFNKRFGPGPDEKQKYKGVEILKKVVEGGNQF